MDEAGKQMQAGEVGAEFDAQEKAEIARKVGLAAVKFADLSNHRQSDYIFDLERFSQFEGKTGPYHLYAAVRMKAILRKSAERGLAPGILKAASGPADRELMLVLSALPGGLRPGGGAQHAPQPLRVCLWPGADFQQLLSELQYPERRGCFQAGQLAGPDPVKPDGAGGCLACPRP